MIRKPLAWWSWLAIVLLLTAALAGAPGALAAAIGVAAAQLAVHLWLGRGSPTFPVQVRAAYLALLLAGAWPPLTFIHWIQVVGTWSMVLVDYCFLARCLSLAPWNRRGPLTLAEAARVFLRRPVAGSILDAPADTRRPA